MIMKYPLDINLRIILVEVLIHPEINKLQPALDMITELHIMSQMKNISMDNCDIIETDTPISFRSKILELFVY